MSHEDGEFSDITAEIDEMLARPDVQDEVAAARAAMSGTWQVVSRRAGGRLVAVVPRLGSGTGTWAYDWDTLDEHVRELIAAAKGLPAGAWKNLKLEWVEAGDE